MDDLSQARSMQFMRYVIVWILRLVCLATLFILKPLTDSSVKASQQNLPTEKLRIPLADTQPEIFKFLPEYFLEVRSHSYIIRRS